MTFIGPCETEDQQTPSCYWNAPTMGNSQGNSWVYIEDIGVTPIEGCQIGEGLPAVDITPEGVPWAYCEPALGNWTEPVPTPAEPVEDTYVPPAPVDTPTQPVPETIETVTTPPTTPVLAETGLDDVDPVLAIIGAVLLVAGAITLRLNRA